MNKFKYNPKTMEIWYYNSDKNTRRRCSSPKLGKAEKYFYEDKTITTWFYSPETGEVWVNLFGFLGRREINILCENF